MKLSFFGASQQVTGSMYLLESDSGFKILIDCGLSYESKQNFGDNANFPFWPEKIDVVLLTHAHVDHSGNLPTLVKQGFTGNIICTVPTAKLIGGLLDDSASIQSLKRKRGHKNGGETRLYGYKEVKDALDLVLTVPFYKEFELEEGISITYYEAGHILGAGSVIISIFEDGETKRIGFTGDLGPDNSAIVVDPRPMDRLDYLICESTYGNRLHKDKESAEAILLKHIQETCVDFPGRLIIPAFSIGRTQSILFTLNKLNKQGKLPNIRIINDSPLAILGTRIHDECKTYLNKATQEFYEEYDTLFEFKQLFTIEDDEDKEELKNYSAASVIVSSAGMMEGGRIQQHIAANLQNPMCRILVAGFCAPGTVGYDLLHNRGTIRMKGELRNVFASVESTDVLSAHPDSKGLLAYVKAVNRSNKVKNIFLVHGDPESLEGFKSVLNQAHFDNVIIPQKGEEFEL
jgi:metallo-beta-lactamase family protein